MPRIQDLELAKDVNSIPAIGKEKPRDARNDTNQDNAVPKKESNHLHAC